jgi:hypothetical protein
MDALNWSTELTGSCGIAWWLATNGVVEDVNARGTGTFSSQACLVEVTLLLVFTYASFRSCSTSL